MCRLLHAWATIMLVGQASSRGYGNRGITEYTPGCRLAGLGHEEKSLTTRAGIMMEEEKM